MVSMAQMSALLELSRNGWFDVAPPYTEDTPIGGPQVMMNEIGDVIRVYPDGSAVRLGPVSVMQGDETSCAARAIKTDG